MLYEISYKAYKNFKFCYTRSRIKHIKILCYVIRDLVGNNNSSVNNCIFYLIKKSNKPEDGS